MLSITYGYQAGKVVGVKSTTASFVSCIATLANAHIGVRPYIPLSLGRVRSSQLLVRGMYVSGVGVSREIVSLPVPRIGRIFDVDTGEPAKTLKGSVKVVFSLESATVESTERIRMMGVDYILKVRQFIDTPDNMSVSTIIQLRQIGGAKKRCQVRMEYGVDHSALNEYLGNSDWLTARHYNVDRGVLRGHDFNMTVRMRERQIKYCFNVADVNNDSTPIVYFGDGDHNVASLTFDFSTVKDYKIYARWQISDDRQDQMFSQSHLSADPIEIESLHNKIWSKLWADHGVCIRSQVDKFDIGIKYAIFQLLQSGVGFSSYGRGLISPARGLTSTYHSGAAFF